MRNYIKNMTLSTVNHIRHDRGQTPLDDLPKGWRADNNGCPLAVAFDHYNWPQNKIPVHEEISCALFMALFDLGMYPEYDAGLPKKQKSAPRHTMRRRMGARIRHSHKRTVFN